MLVGAASPLHYLPIVSTVIAAGFAVVLWRRWRKSPDARYLMWWTIGVALFGLGTLAEAVTTLAGWSEPAFRTWYIAGALLGGAPLAQGTVYLLMGRHLADRLAVGLIAYAALAAGFVLATPLTETARLDGDAIKWPWVRLLSLPLNIYAVVFLVGGAIWSARKYRQTPGAGARVVGNWLIAVGALLPAVGGAFARAGHVEVLYVGELIGLLLIWAGYSSIARNPTPSIHR